MTPEIKRDVLGANMLRLHGIDEGRLASELADDEVSRRRDELGPERYHVPWRLHRERLRAGA